MIKIMLFKKIKQVNKINDNYKFLKSSFELEFPL